MKNIHVFFAIVVFICVLILYTHIHHHIKVCDDMEIFRLNHVMQYNLNELDKLKQPILFAETHGEDIFLKKIGEITQLPTSTSESESSFDINSNKNSELKLYCDEYDAPIRPSNSISICNLWTGQNIESKLQYSIYKRTFIVPLNEPVTVRLTCPKNSIALFPQLNYELFEFTSNTTPNKCPDITFLDTVVTPGQYLCIPPYWWFTVVFGKNKTHTLYSGYATPINILANISYYTRYWICKMHTDSKSMSEEVKRISV